MKPTHYISLPGQEPIPVSAVQFKANDIESAKAFCYLTGNDLPSSAHPSSILYRGDLYKDGDWAVKCLCGDCESGIDRWKDDDFNVSFLPTEPIKSRLDDIIDNAPESPLDRPPEYGPSPWGAIDSTKLATGIRNILPNSVLADMVSEIDRLATTLRQVSIAETKQFRMDLDEVLQEIKGAKRQTRERALAITKIQEAIMWLGMDLKDIGTPTPYPSSYDPTSSVVHPTADGLKL